MKKELIDYMAKTCHYAQDNLKGYGYDLLYVSPKVIDGYLEAISYVVSRFLAQNTRNGYKGVETEIIMNELKELPNPLAKSKNEIERWKKIIQEKANIFNIG